VPDSKKKLTRKADHNPELQITICLYGIIVISRKRCNIQPQFFVWWNTNRDDKIKFVTKLDQNQDRLTKTSTPPSECQ